MHTRLVSALAIVVAACLSVLEPTPAFAAGSHVSIDHVRVTGAGRHEVIVRVQDDTGAPVERLESELAVTLDAHGVGETRTEYSGGTGARALTVVIDAPLLRGASAAVVDEVLRMVARELASGDRVTVVLAGDRPVAKDWSARELAQAGDQLASVAAAGGPRLFDALKLAAEKAVSTRRCGAGALLVLTRAEDRGSRARASDVLAAALRGGVTSLALVLVPGGEAGGQQQLEGLVTRTGGAQWQVGPGGAVPPSLGPGVRALLDRYRVTFRDSRWKRDGEQHQLEARVGDAGSEVVGQYRYRSNEVYVPAWWSTAAIGIILGAIVLVAVGFVLSRRRKQVCLLVVRGGEEDAQWYEVFDLPLRIGSARENDVVLVHDGVSRNHCLLERDGRSVVLVDTNSEFGSYVNGTRVTRHVLAEDDVLRLGTDVELAYEAR